MGALRDNDISYPIFDKPILSTEEVAYLLNKSVRTIKRYVQHDDIPYRKRKGSTYFLRTEIMDWIDQGD
jgi:predicted DNA-binding transcriptional regulator AlpA